MTCVVEKAISPINVPSSDVKHRIITPIEAKPAHYRPSQLQQVETPWMSRHSVHEGGKVVSPKHRLSLPQETERQQGLSQRKAPLTTPTGNKSATFRLEVE